MVHGRDPERSAKLGRLAMELAGDARHHGLGRAARGVVLAEDEEGVLADVAPERGEVGRRELAEPARDQR